MCSYKGLYISGGILIVVFAIFAGIFGVIFTVIMENILVIDPDHSIYDSFVTPPVPVYFKFYIFTVNNPLEVQYYGAKPNVTEIGPFTYSETMTKVDLEPNVPYAPGTIEYKQNSSYNFVPEMSVHGEDYKITTINPIALITAALFYDNLLFKELIWPEIERTTNLFETHTVSEFLFEGFVMPVYNFDFPEWIPIVGKLNLTGTLYEILCQISEEKLCIDFLQPNRIGYFTTDNNTNDGLYRVNTGAEGMDEYLYVREWKGETSLDFWNDEYCDMINGTDGTQFPPGVDKDKRLYLYTSDLCRSIYFTYEKDVRVVNSIDAWRFIVPPEVLEDPNVSGDNACYCIKVYEGDEKCLRSSMLNMAPCSAGAPVVLSLPHFYQSDGEELKFVGLNPVKELHETFLDVEPVTGVVMSAAKRIQINLPLRRYGNLPMFQNVPEVIFPVFWGDEGAEIGKEDAEDLNMVLTLPFILVYTFCGLLIALGVALIVLGYYKKRKAEKKDENESPLVNLDR